MQTLRRPRNPAVLTALVIIGIIQPAVAQGPQVKTAEPVYRSGEPIRVYYDSGQQPPAPPAPYDADNLPDFSEPLYSVVVSWDVRVCRSGTELFRRLGRSEVPVGTSLALPSDVYANTQPRGWCTLRQDGGLAPGEYEVRLFEMQSALGVWPEDKPYPEPFSLLARQRFRITGAPTYKPPPAMTVEAACFPREPAPHAPVTVALRTQNRGDITAASVVVNLEFLDPHRGKAPRDLETRTSFCQALGAGRFRCELGDVEPDWTADIEFTASAPAGGTILWRATLGSAGDLGGPAEFGGILGERAPPAIVDVVVLADQKKIVNTVPSYAYPIGRYKRVGTSRYLLVVGRNLPQRPGQDLELGSANPDVHCVFVAFPDTKNFTHKELFEEGWGRFYELDDRSAAIERAAEDGYDGLLVRADLGKGVLPGRKTVRVKGAEGHWALEFGDLSATIAFVREVKEDKKKEFDILRNAYWPGRIHVAVVTSHELEIEEIPILLKASELSADLEQEIKLTARRAEELGRRVYLSEPLDIHGRRSTPYHTGGVALPVDGRRPTPMTLEARVDERFIHDKFRMPITPAIASVVLKAWPEGVRRNCLWHDALNRAARARDKQPEDWNALSEQESENVWNAIVFKWDILEQSVKFGQHAAAILLRDTFVSVMERQVLKLEWVRSNRRQTLGLLQSMRPRAMDDSLPLNRMKVHDPSGREIEYRYIILNDVPFLAELHGRSEEQIKAWQVQQTQAALDRLIEAAKQTIELAVQTEDKEVEDLILLTGFNFEPMARLLKAELVRRQKRTLADGSTRWAWVPDTAARHWVDQVAPLARAIREQQRLASADTDLCLTAVTLATLPFMLAENTGIVLVCFAADLLDLGVTTVQELSQYWASEHELDFALGASIVIGVERHDQAVRNAKGWVSTAFGIGASAPGVFAGVFEVVPKLTALRRISRGRIIAAATTPTDVLKLEPVNLRDFLAFAINARAKGVAHGLDSLTAVERHAIDVVEEVAASKHATAVFSEPDLPASNLASSFSPSSPVRFDVDAQSGLATARPPSGRRVSAPRSSSGNPANGLNSRAPEGSVVMVLGEDGTPKQLLLGDEFGRGSFNEVFRHPEDPEKWVIRVPQSKARDAAAILDEHGWDLLENINSPHVRLVEVKEVYDMAEGSGIGRVRVVEFIKEGPASRIISSQGRMTSDQVLALDAALRDLNRRGFVWLDNHPGNFSFVPAAEGGGRLQVVIIDPGGIVRVRNPELARRIQQMANGDFRTHYPDYPALEGHPEWRADIRKTEILDGFSDDIITPEGISLENLFNPCLGESSAHLARIFDVDD